MIWRLFNYKRLNLGLTNKKLRKTLSILSVSQIVSWGSIYYSFSLYIEPIHLEYGWAKNQIIGALTLGLLVWALSAPVISTYLEEGRGKQVMALGSLTGSFGFLLWALFPGHLLLFYLSWIIIGLSMAMTLYTSAFTILAKQFPGNYKHSMSLLTLAGGFASTIFIPFIQLNIEYFGWQNSIYILALINLCIAAPLHYFGLRDNEKTAYRSPDNLFSIDIALFYDPRFNRRYFTGLLIWFVSYDITASAITFVFIPVLSAMELEMPVIIFVMALIGPMQVAGRFLYMIVVTRVTFRTISILLAASLICGTSLLIVISIHLYSLIIFVVLFGIAKGIMTIIKGTAVMELMGGAVYARTNGWLSSGSTLANAIAPLLFGLIWHHTGDPRSVLLACWAVSFFIIPGIYLLLREAEKNSITQNSTLHPGKSDDS